MHTTREEWLSAAAEELWKQIELAGAKRVAIKVSVGFPSTRALSVKRRHIGECWSAKCSADGAAQIFIHPGLSNPVEILAVLAHEMIHAATPGCKHGKGFGRVARPLGLVGPLTATVAGPELTDQLTALAMKVGSYPQAAFDPSYSDRKKQGTRMLKATCPNCGYLVRITSKWLAVGLPICPCGEVMVQDEGVDEGAGEGEGE